MADGHNITASNGRQTPSAVQNRHFIGDSLAILLCPGPYGATVGVTIDREDLQRVLAMGLWRVSEFPAGLYCYKIKGRRGNLYLHRFILDAQKGEYVDHQFQRTLDNRKTEIRKTTQSVNQLNRVYGGHGRSGYRGVYWKKGKWVAHIVAGGKRHHLGTFTDPAVAAEVSRKFLISQGAKPEVLARTYSAGAQ